MGKRVLLIVFVLVLALFAYVGYHTYDAKRAGATGDVFSGESSAQKVGTRDETSDDRSSSSEKVVYPAATPGQGAQPAAPADGGTQTTQSMQPAPTTAPGSDTISPNPPNGMVFSGTGRYQLYRQGDITWRLDTDTGRTCIIFATDEQWKKPRVYRAGCGSK